jgi:hypothetical protein
VHGQREDKGEDAANAEQKSALASGKMGLTAAVAAVVGAAIPAAVGIVVDGLPGKLLELLRELVPGAARLGVLINVSDQTDLVQWRDTQAAAAALSALRGTGRIRLST